MSETVVVAMSGGVDSAVAAALLVEAGYRVVGMTMRVWSGGEDAPAAPRSCCSLDDVEDARRVAALLDIPYYALDMKDAFREAVIGEFVGEYLAGRTPNPCVTCNGDMKFGALLERAAAVGASRVATGHYARVARDPASGRFELRRGRDPGKDQSYALHVLTQDQLGRALFPLGELTKEETRAHAARLGLPVSGKADSQDICFVPGGDYREFLASQVGDAVRPGRFRSVEGEDLGEHRGVPFYTVGQRRWLGIQGHDRRYVVELRPEADEVVVGTRDQASRAAFRVEGMNWVSRAAPAAPLRCEVKIRHRSPPAAAEVRPRPGGALEVLLDIPDLGVAPGQAAVLYDGDLVLGGGRIAGGAPGALAV